MKWVMMVGLFLGMSGKTVLLGAPSIFVGASSSCDEKAKMSFTLII